MRLWEAVTQNWGGFPCRLQGPHLSTINCVVPLCPQEFADPPSQICLNLSVRVCDTDETVFGPFLIEIPALYSPGPHLLMDFSSFWGWQMSMGLQKGDFALAHAPHRTVQHWLLPGSGSWWDYTASPVYFTGHISCLRLKLWDIFEFLSQNSWTIKVTWPAVLTDRMESLQQCRPRTFMRMCTDLESYRFYLC